MERKIISDRKKQYVQMHEGMSEMLAVIWEEGQCGMSGARLFEKVMKVNVEKGSKSQIGKGLGKYVV